MNPAMAGRWSVAYILCTSPRQAASYVFCKTVLDGCVQERGMAWAQPVCWSEGVTNMSVALEVHREFVIIVRVMEVTAWELKIGDNVSRCTLHLCVFFIILYSDIN